MREIGLEEYKQVVYDTLYYVKTVCENNGIDYYIAYGTLLGAVRHKGFIPWDDDIDIIMDRDNFIKLLDVMKHEPQKRYQLLSVESSKKYDLPLPKIVDTNTLLVQSGRKQDTEIGAWVDIIIIDDVPNDEKKRRKFLKKMNFFENCWEWAQYSRLSVRNAKNLAQFVKFVIYKTLALPGSRRWSLFLNRKAQKYNHKNCEYFAAVAFAGGKRKAYSKRYLGAGTKLKFESDFYNAPERWDEYLTVAYGNYMELPPVEERISNHRFKVYWKE